MSNTIMNALVYNNRFANEKITGDQIGVENFETWKTMLENLHRAAYAAYVVCENSGLTAESVSIDKTAVFDAIRPILSVIGDVNGHKLYANAEMAVAMIAYSGKRANKDAGELQLVNSQISNTKKAIATYEKINVADKAFKESKLSEMNAALEKLIDEKDLTSLICVSNSRPAPHSMHLDLTLNTSLRARFPDSLRKLLMSLTLKKPHVKKHVKPPQKHARRKRLMQTRQNNCRQFPGGFLSKAPIQRHRRKYAKRRSPYGKKSHKVCTSFKS